MFFLATESGDQEVVPPSLAFTRCRHQPRSISPGRKEGYILHNALSSCVGRLRVFEKLQDLLQALLVWLPVHGARRTAGVGAWVSAGSLGFCVRPNLNPQGRGGCMQTQSLSAEKQRPRIRAYPSVGSPPAKPSSATHSRARECEWGEYKSGPSGPVAGARRIHSEPNVEPSSHGGGATAAAPGYGPYGFRLTRERGPCPSGLPGEGSVHEDSFPQNPAFKLR